MDSIVHGIIKSCTTERFSLSLYAIIEPAHVLETLLEHTLGILNNV